MNVLQSIKCFFLYASSFSEITDPLFGKVIPPAGQQINLEMMSFLESSCVVSKSVPKWFSVIYRLRNPLINL